LTNKSSLPILQVEDKSIHELHELGSQLFTEGKYPEAEPILKEIISINPKYADVHNKLGVISHLKSDFKLASQYFKKALELNPNYTEASLNLAITYNDMEEFKKAQEVFTLAAQRAHPLPLQSTCSLGQVQMSTTSSAIFTLI
jgi:Flp pilus assembly protein TadD